MYQAIMSEELNEYWHGSKGSTLCIDHFTHNFHAEKRANSHLNSWKDEQEKWNKERIVVVTVSI